MVQRRDGSADAHPGLEKRGAVQWRSEVHYPFVIGKAVVSGSGEYLSAAGGIRPRGRVAGSAFPTP